MVISFQPFGCTLKPLVGTEVIDPYVFIAVVSVNLCIHYIQLFSEFSSLLHFIIVWYVVSYVSFLFLYL